MKIQQPHYDRYARSINFDTEVILKPKYMNLVEAALTVLVPTNAEYRIYSVDSTL